MTSIYYNKYIKYKSKYNNLKNILYGGSKCPKCNRLSNPDSPINTITQLSNTCCSHCAANKTTHSKRCNKSNNVSFKIRLLKDINNNPVIIPQHENNLYYITIIDRLKPYYNTKRNINHLNGPYITIPNHWEVPSLEKMYLKRNAEYRPIKNTNNFAVLVYLNGSKTLHVTFDIVNSKEEAEELVENLNEVLSSLGDF